MSHLTLVPETADASQDGGVAVVATTGPENIYDEPNLFTARKAPWMKLGKVIDDDVDAAEAARLGGLDFDIALYPAGFTKNGGKNYKRVPQRLAIVREDTGEWFNWASPDYGVVQYRDAFTFLDKINPRYVAAGALRGGRVGFVVVQHPDVTNLTGLTLKGVEDPHELYVVVRTSQDLSYSLDISLMTLRGRCMNELTLPTFTRNAPQRWRLRHTKSVHQRMHQAQVVLTRAGTYADEFQKITARLADIDVDFDHAQRTLRYVLPDRPRRDQQIDQILDVYRESTTNGFQGTGWGLVQGVSEYYEWARPRAQTAGVQFVNALDGSTHKHVAKTAQVLLATAR
jgi:phage/plasmid-like protein (TIGR03299 family)